MIWIIVLYVVFDGVQFLLQSVFRSVGEQEMAAKIVLFTLWLVGVPMALFMGKFAGFGAAGVMGGFLLGFLVEIPAMMFFIARWDWDALARRASLSLDETLEKETLE